MRNTAAAALEAMRKAHDEIRRETELVNLAVAGADEQGRAVGAMLGGQVATMKAAAGAVSGELSQVRQMVQGETRAMLAESREASDAIARAREALAEQRRELEEELAAARELGSETGRELGAQNERLVAAIEGADARGHDLEATLGARSDAVAGVAGSTAARAQEVMATIEGQVSTMSDTAERLDRRVGDLRETLRGQLGVLMSTTDYVSGRVDSIFGSFRAQQQALLGVVEEAERKAGELRVAQLSDARGVLLHMVNRVLDSLGSLGTDLGRMLEGDLPDRVWRRYLEGDRTVALRRLARGLRDRDAIARVRRSFEDDPEFRHLASRHLAEFEHLLTQAGDTDPEDLVSASLLTADVGKAYLLPSRATGRLS
ncbi:MAG: hypothetical protein EXQ97_01585 [Alphaproteobacteria bacterium]|nr:hypothetical protein [Alphaproteobacteria bacterium]